MPCGLMPAGRDKGAMHLPDPPGGQMQQDGSLLAEALEGVVYAIIFRNEQNGYTVLTLDDTDGPTAVGTMPFLHEGEAVRLSGHWVEHPDYGPQFQADHYELMAPRTEKAILQYLSSGLIKGIGKKTARRLYREFGSETLDILREEPARAARIKGISLDKALKISAQLQEKRAFQDLILLLAPLGIGTGTIWRIYKRYGSESIRQVSEDPYCLADEVFGIGFLTADRLARSLGLDPRSPGRINGALRYVLTQATFQGHTWLSRDILLRQASELLHIDLDGDVPVLSGLADSGQIVRSGSQFGERVDSRISLAGLFHTERIAAERLILLLGSAPRSCSDLLCPETAAKALDQTCSRQHLKLAPEQHGALLMALQQTVMILTGGPGTGKTTIIRLLCDCLGRRSSRIMLAAPTGRAAKRLGEATGMQAKTLHRLLEIQAGQTTDHQEAANQIHSAKDLDCDLLVVDESSMLDIFLFRTLLESLKPGTRLILAGDADQLPSVGPGDVLRDLINSGKVPVARLTQVFRQSAESLIIRNAHRIHDGLWPELDQSRDSQFLFVPKDTGEAVAQAVVRLVRDILPQTYGLDPMRDVQILTPSRKGPAGTLALNQALQQVLLPPDSHQAAVRVYGKRFHAGDKVMQTRNNYDLEWRQSGQQGQSGSGVFNGETGTVLQIDEDLTVLEVLYDDDRVVAYDQASLDDLDLAYAMTVHKSQGSEYPVVVLAVAPGAPQLLNRNLLYTAVTRARHKLLLISSRWVISQMLRNDQAQQRYTLLRDFLTFL